MLNALPLCVPSCLGAPTAVASLCLSFLIWEPASNSSLRVLEELTHVSGEDQSLAVSKYSLMVVDVEDQRMGELRGCVLPKVGKTKCKTYREGTRK